jgi:hypothetical protein
VTWIELDAGDFAFVSGTPAEYESRPQVTQQFCSKSGTQLTCRHAAAPDEIDVTACSLDDVDGISPEDLVWSDRMVPWLRTDDGLPPYRSSRSDG